MGLIITRVLGKLRDLLDYPSLPLNRLLLDTGLLWSSLIAVEVQPRQIIGGDVLVVLLENRTDYKYFSVFCCASRYCGPCAQVIMKITRKSNQAFITKKHTFNRPNLAVVSASWAPFT